MRRALLPCLLAAVLGGCGAAAEVRERDLVSDAPAAPAPRPATTPDGSARGGVRIAVITHGQASSGFWSIVKNGVDAAGRQMDVAVTYRSPDVYSVASMSRQIDEAVASRPDGLVVSLPSPALDRSVRRAVRAGIPVVSINSGSDHFRRLGVLAHVGQEEGAAGAAAARRLAAAGVRHALCFNHEVGNAGTDTRCRAFSRAMRAAGRTSRTVGIVLTDVDRTQRRLAAAFADPTVDGALTLSSNAAEPVLAAVRAAGRENSIAVGTFDLSPEVLRAVREGRLRFAIDQQAYLQGYLPVVLLGQLARYGLFAAQGEVIPTGPHFVTRATADQAIRLSQRGIR
ncbi:MAG TPA: substrate-binding domain-containing protein [Solirubrobacteraceae bacterium]|nr:substrate-binding domain-containing protein [Solirubrobacteraceae bacterium]